jgi:ABC-type nitrate/sulfonate/bicarbonate transport system substrate-binding protein
MEPLIKIDRGIPFVLTLGAHKGCIMAAAQPEVKTWKDLKGKTVGVNFFGSNPYYLALYQLHQAGLDPKRDVRVVTIAGPDLVPALRDRKIDAFVMWDPAVPLLKDLKIPHTVLLDIGKDSPWKEHICCFMMSERSFVEKHPGTIKRLNQAFVLAARWVHESPAHQREAIDINIKERFTPTALARADFQYSMLHTYDYSVAGDRAQGERSLRVFAEMAGQMGAIKLTPDQMVAKAWRPYQDLPDTPL